MAKEKSLCTIAFPVISTRVYRFFKKAAAKIAVSTVKKFIKENPRVFQEIIFVLFDKENYQIYEELLRF